ncbi:hypothetical protein Tco_1138849 [Tanacetum coccineum]
MFRSNNGTEFVNNKLSMFFVSKGFPHLSCLEHPLLSESKSSKLINQSESELNLLNFFDNFDDNTLKSPNDDERDPSISNGNVMASSDVDSSPPINKEATFATQSDENNDNFKGNSVEMSGSRSRIEPSSRTNNVDEP